MFRHLAVLPIVASVSALAAPTQCDIARNRLATARIELAQVTADLLDHCTPIQDGTPDEWPEEVCDELWDEATRLSDEAAFWEGRVALYCRPRQS